MHILVGRFFQVFGAGAIAGFLQTILIWLVGQFGMFALLQLPLKFELNLVWFYQRITWGGLWGLVFLIPLLRSVPQWKRGLVFGILPALLSLFVFLPFKDGHGYMGLNLGVMMPIVVVGFGLIWGMIAGSLLDRTQPDPDDEPVFAKRD